MTRNLSGLISSNDLISNSEYMQSVVFIIPETSESSWLDEYESILPLGAVPRSARALHREDGQVLYSVVVMKKFMDEYIKASHAKKYLARTDFEFSSEQEAQESESCSKLEADVKSQWVFKKYVYDLLPSFYRPLLYGC